MNTPTQSQIELLANLKKYADDSIIEYPLLKKPITSRFESVEADLNDANRYKKPEEIIENGYGLILDVITNYIGSEEHEEDLAGA